MADTTVSVKKDGTGDYTTISSAEAASDVSSGYYKIEIQDAGQYNESVNISGATGTESSSNYVWLTVASAYRHSGVAATSGHARIYDASATVVIASDNFTRVEYLDIHNTSGGAGHALRALSAENVLFSRCILRGNPGSSGMGCYFYTGSGSIDNCLIYQNRYGIYIYFIGTASNINIDACTSVNNTFHAVQSDTYGALTIYNGALGDSGTSDLKSSNSSIAWSGSHNAWDTDTSNINNYPAVGVLTSSQDISSGGVTTTTTTANAMIVTDLTPGSENYTPVPATGAGSNLLLGNGINRQGSEPDSRQDFSTDIRGAARPTTAGKIDIGAFQITTAAGFKYWDGAAWADSTAVQYWNGSAWTDVTGIQYWNGSAWTDPS
jgi:hypothetical protein